MKSKVLNILTISALLVMFCSVSSANAASMYKLDNATIDAIFDNSVEISILDAAFMLGGHSSEAMLYASSNPWVAAALCFIVGGFGIHRHYLGTKPFMWAYYTFTCGGIFGVVTFIDFVVLLVGAITNDIGSYAGNSSFFMWL